MSAPKQQQAPESVDNTLSADLQKAFDSAGELLSTYQYTWSARLVLAQQEWALTKNAASMVLILALFMAAVIASLWLIINATIGTLLYQNGVPLWIIGLTLILTNTGLIVVLWTTMRHLLHNIGFSQLVKSLSGEKSPRSTNVAS